MIPRWTTVVMLALISLTSMISAWPDIDIPDDVQNRFPDNLPNIPDFPESWTLPPGIFRNLTISPECDVALARLFSDQRSEDATLALDAWGKPQPGFLAGNLAWLGHYPECKSLDEFHFCMTYVRLNVSLSGVSPVLRWGLCLPQACSESDVAASLSEIIDKLEYDELDSLNPMVTKVHCATDPARPFDAGFYATAALCCVAAVLMIWGALLDAHLKHQKEECLEASENLPLIYHTSHKHGYGAPAAAVDSQDKAGKEGRRETRFQRFLLCFAFTRNLEQIMNTKTKEGNMLCLNGIRVISIMWVILGHTYFLLYLVMGFIWEGVYAFEQIKSFPMQAVVNAFPAVDTFFLLSGLLLTYITLGRLARTGGKLPWGLFYFHRYWRLLPGLGCAMLFTLYLRPYFGEGPVWEGIARNSLNCDKYWWTNLLYINNFYPVSGTAGCIYWVWYLANDMQFYVISPIILIALYRKPIVGLLILLGLGIASIATTISLMVVNDYSAALMGVLDKNRVPGDDLFSVVYVKPYCRITPYLVGMAMGYAFHSWRGRRVRIKKAVAVCGWLCATATGLAVVYGLYGDFHGNPLSTAANAIYMSLAHVAWSCVLAWVIFACHYGYGGWVDDFLSWRAWIPLCRLTYSTYLFHPLVLNILAGNTPIPFSGNAVFASYYFVGTTVFSYAISLLVSLAFEIPFANLEGMLTS